MLWSQSQLQVTPRLIDSKKTELAFLESCPHDEYDSTEVNALRREINILVEKEEIFWWQRSRVAWLKERDRNTQFFHACASQQKKVNTIMGLQDQNGVWSSDPIVIKDTTVAYFHNLFVSSNPDAIDKVVQHVEGVVTPNMNEALLRPFSNEEIHHALFQMSPSKAPGPDGMTTLFFQKYWHIVGGDVTLAILDFFSSGCMLGSINFTNIVLIPKVKSPESMTQFRPINLCNVLYKIVSKILVNRMKVVLPRLIS